MSRDVPRRCLQQMASEAPLVAGQSQGRKRGAWEVDSGTASDAGADDVGSAPPQRRRGRGRPRKQPAAPPQAAAPTGPALARQVRQERGRQVADHRFLGSCDMGAILRPIGNGIEAACATAILRESIRRNTALDDLVEGCLGSAPRIAMPLTAEARMYGASRTHFPEKIADLAAAVFYSSRCFASSIWSHVCHEVREGRLVPIAALTMLQYDETPMVVRSDPAAQSARADQQPAAAPSDTGKQRWKLFQRECMCGVIVQSPSSGMIRFITLPLPMPLSASDQSTAEVLDALMRRDECTLLWSSLRQLFAARGACNIDVSSCDSASSNLRWEQHRQNTAPDVWRLRLGCEVHQVSNVQVRAYDILPGMISGLIAFALTQQAGGATAKLRHALAQTIAANVVVVDALPPAETDPRSQHRDAVLDLCLPDTLAGQRRRYVLQSLNGHPGLPPTPPIHLCHTPRCHSARACACLTVEICIADVVSCLVFVQAFWS